VKLEQGAGSHCFACSCWLVAVLCAWLGRARKEAAGVGLRKELRLAAALRWLHSTAWMASKQPAATVNGNASYLYLQSKKTGMVVYLQRNTG
jgi:hypothetical protein